MFEARHKRRECIGWSACTERAPQYWILDEDGLATLLTQRRQHGSFVYGEGFPDDAELLRETELACPVKIIQIA